MRSNISFINSVLLQSLSLALFCAQGEVDAKEVDPPSLLTVRGEAIIQVPADQLSLTLGVITEAENAEEALAKNNAIMSNVVQHLKDTGLESKELRTGKLSLRPLHSKQPKDAPEGWLPKILGFEALNLVIITTEKLAQASQFIDAASKAGANQIQEIQFNLRDKQKWRNTVIKEAAENAIADAISLTTAAHVKLGRIIDLKLDDVAAPGRFALKAMAYNTNSSSAPIEEGLIELRANVTAVYKLE